MISLHEIVPIYNEKLTWFYPSFFFTFLNKLVEKPDLCWHTRFKMCEINDSDSFVSYVFGEGGFFVAGLGGGVTQSSKDLSSQALLSRRSHSLCQLKFQPSWVGSSLCRLSSLLEKRSSVTEKLWAILKRSEGLSQYIFPVNCFLLLLPQMFPILPRNGPRIGCFRPVNFLQVRLTINKWLIAGK